MENRGLRNLLIFGTIVCVVVFLILTIDTHRKIPSRTKEDNLTEEVVSGKRVWHKYNCNDCHTILGIGGYYAPDLTKVFAQRGESWLEAFLRNPESQDPKRRKMPNYGLSKEEIEKLIIFFKWVSEIDTNGWPPHPVIKKVAFAKPKGEELYQKNRCDLCHQIKGKGEKIGPDLSEVGSKHEREWIYKMIKDPKSINPNSGMPSFSQLSEEEIQAIVEYLVTLK